MELVQSLLTLALIEGSLNEWLELAAWLFVYTSAAWLAVSLWRRGLASMREGRRLSREALLARYSDDALQAVPTTRWPVRGRWPSPYNHPQELTSESRRSTYALLARQLSKRLSQWSEVVMLAAAALGYVTMYSVVREILALDVPTAAEEGLGAFFPAWSAPLLVLETLLPAFAVVVLVVVAFSLRERSDYMSTLAAAYDAIPQVRESPSGKSESRLRRWLRRIVLSDSTPKELV